MKNSCGCEILVDLETNTISTRMEDDRPKDAKNRLKLFGKNILEETSKMLQQTYVYMYIHYNQVILS